jgi:hypothetical protein
MRSHGIAAVPLGSRHLLLKDQLAATGNAQAVAYAVVLDPNLALALEQSSGIENASRPLGGCCG